MKRCVQNTQVQTRRMRNPLHDHPLLKKGGKHQKPNKALRQQARQALRRGWRCLMVVVVTGMRQRHLAAFLQPRKGQWVKSSVIQHESVG